MDKASEAYHFMALTLNYIKRMAMFQRSKLDIHSLVCFSHTYHFMAEICNTYYVPDKHVET